MHQFYRYSLPIQGYQTIFVLLFNNIKIFLVMILLDAMVGTSVTGLGSILAIVLSWSRNKSILWAILHAFCGWLYVIYFAVSR